MFRLFFAIAVICLSGTLPGEYWPAQLLLIVMLWAAAVISGAQFGAMLQRLVLFLPFVVGISLGVPVTQDGRWPWEWSATILCRSLVAFFAGIWLVHALPFAELQGVLRRLRTPEVFIASLAFMHRYVIVLWEELQRLKTARRARSGRTTLFRTWITSAQLIGELLIRAWDRAERVHRAMLARGGHPQQLSRSRA
jgi:cobalt/nickel transport system permease protein